MKFYIGLLSVLFLLSGVGVALAADSNNNGVADDETFVPQVFDGTADRSSSVLFPTSGDTWSVLWYPYWWNPGDTAYGMHTVTLPTVCHADVALKISENVLTDPGHVDLDFRINGTTVGSFVITAADGTGYVYGSFDFAPVAPPFELRYYETNQVALGFGSIGLDESGLSSVSFSSECATATENTTWGAIKAVYR